MIPSMDLQDAQRRARGPVTRILGPRCPDDVEDCLQDAACNAIRRFKTFRGESRFDTWFTRIAINLALMRVRPLGWNKATRVELDAPFVDTEGNLTTMDLPSQGPGPSELYDAQELFERLNKAKLSYALREELGLMLMDDRRGRNEPMRKARRFRLREELRRQL